MQRRRTVDIVGIILVITEKLRHFQEVVAPHETGGVAVENDYARTLVSDGHRMGTAVPTIGSTRLWQTREWWCAVMGSRSLERVGVGEGTRGDVCKAHCQGARDFGERSLRSP